MDQSLESSEQSLYTLTEVTEHNTPEDCWMVMDGVVYDLSEYLPNHDRFMSIQEWCGKDITEDFKSKAGEGRDHTGGYRVIANYEIGRVTEVPTIGIQEALVATVAIGIASALAFAAWKLSQRG